MVQAKAGGWDIDPAEVELFCKNAAFVKLVNADKGESGLSRADRLRQVYGESMSSCRCQHSGKLESILTGFVQRKKLRTTAWLR